MNRKKIMKQVSLLFIGTILCVSPLKAEEQANVDVKQSSTLTKDQAAGLNLFEGSTRFENGGPACISCHNVTNDNVMPGGLYAKDLTSTNGIMASSFAQTLPNAPMKASYGNKPLTASELELLTAFFDYSSTNKDSQTLNSGFSLFFIGGGIGLVCIFILVQLIWSNRKKKMVKESIFGRQKGSFDAKF